jgi:hypothetical protein
MSDPTQTPANLPVPDDGAPTTFPDGRTARGWLWPSATAPTSTPSRRRGLGANSCSWMSSGPSLSIAAGRQ